MTTGAKGAPAREQTEGQTTLCSIIHEQLSLLEELDARRHELQLMVEHLLAGANSSPAAGISHQPVPKVSRREREVLALMAEGRTSKEIAVQLGVSFKTAVTHRANVMSKLKVHNTVSAVREAFRLKIL